MSFKTNITELINQGLPTRKIAELVGCSRRTVRRYRASMPHTTVPSKRIPKILIVDLETAPMETYTWSLHINGWLSPDKIIKDWSMLSWSAKWLCSANVMSQTVSLAEAHARQDASILEGLWVLLNDADIVVAHNGTRFDKKVANTRFLANRMTPPMPYQLIDTYAVLKKQFFMSSAALDYSNKYFNLQRKIETSFKLWIQCVNGDASALQKMEEYNRGDITALEELYLMLRPWITSHPNVGLYMDTTETVCPNCGSADISWGGEYATPAGLYKAFTCEECGAIGRSRFNSISADKKKTLCLSVAR